MNQKHAYAHVYAHARAHDSARTQHLRGQLDAELPPRSLVVLLALLELLRLLAQLRLDAALAAAQLVNLPREPQTISWPI